MVVRRKALKTLGAGSLWAAPIVQSITLPVHAQTSQMAVTCTISTNESAINTSDDLTGIQATLSPPVQGVVLALDITSSLDPAFGSGGNETTDASGIAMFVNQTAFDLVTPGSVLTLTVSLNPFDDSGVNLTPCSRVVIVNV